MHAMPPRERFKAVMNFQPFDRLPLVEWAVWWDKTLDRWRGEGFPADLTDRYAISRHMGLETYKQAWYFAFFPFLNPKGYGQGVIQSLDEYEALKPSLFPTNLVDSKMWESWAQEQERGDAVLWFTVDGFFHLSRALLGIERHLFAFYEQPDLIHRINTDLTEWILQIIEKVCSICTPDFMTFGEDMSYNHGPMVSKAIFDEFLRPYYDHVVPVLKARGVMPMVDSDGDVTILANWLAEAGIDGMLPLERQAGVDVAQLRANLPSMRFIGHFNKMVMNRGEVAMRTEFERLLPVAAQGGLIISCDHQTPPSVSLKDYQLYLALFREYAAEAGRMSQAMSR